MVTRRCVRDLSGDGAGSGSPAVERIVRRDAIDLGGVRRVELLARLLRVFAARGGAELNLASLANELGVPASTLPPYVDLLEMIYLITKVPAWSRNLGERVIRRSKIVVNDTGLMSSLANLDAGAMKVGSRGWYAAGGLLETFVVGELTKSIPWSETRPRLFFFRDRDGREIDVVLEADDGRVVGIEVKAASSAALGDFKHLRWLRDAIGNDFTAGIVLHTGRETTRFGDRLIALPISALWSDLIPLASVAPGTLDGSQGDLVLKADHRSGPGHVRVWIEMTCERSIYPHEPMSLAGSLGFPSLR